MDGDDIMVTLSVAFLRSVLAHTLSMRSFCECQVTLDASDHLVLGSELLLGVQVDQVVLLLEALSALYP